jgi:hypothetical protein
MATDGTSSLAQWIRELEIGRDPAGLARRRAGVDALLKGANTADVESLVRLAFATKQAPPPEGAARIRQAFTASDDTFASQGNDREMQLLSAAVLTDLFLRTGNVASIAAMATSTAAGLGRPRPDLPLDLPETAEAAMQAQAEGRRRRPDLSALRGTAFPKAEFDKAPAKVQAQGDFTGVIAALTAVTEASKVAFDAAAKHVNDGLTAANAFIAIQDEELQMLWWLTGGRSWDLDRLFAQVPVEERTLVLAKELAGLTLYPPGPPAIKALLARGGVEDKEDVTIAGCVNACDKDWLQSLVDGKDPSPITRPLHFAIKRKLETDDKTAWIAGWSAVTGLDAAKKHSALHVGLLFFRERLLART